MGGRWCSALNCRNNPKRSPFASFFRFPTDEKRCALWAHRCGRPDLANKSIEYIHANCKLCSNHFEASQFLASGRLVWNAVPTLFEGTFLPTLKKQQQESPPARCRTWTETAPSQVPTEEAGRGESDHNYAKLPCEQMEEQCTASPTQCNNESVSPPVERVTLILEITEPTHSSLEQDIERRPAPSDAENASTHLERRESSPAGNSQAHGHRNTSRLEKPSIPKISAKILPRDSSGNAQTRRQRTSSKLLSTKRVQICRLKRRIKQLEKSLKEAQSKSIQCDSVETIVGMAAEYLDETPLQFFASQLRMSKKQTRGRRFTRDDKLFAYALRNHSYSAFRFLQGIFALPSKTALEVFKKQEHIEHARGVTDFKTFKREVYGQDLE